MRSRTIVLIMVIILGLSLVGIFFSKDLFISSPAKEHRNTITMETPYNADGEVAQAVAQLKKSQDKATIIKGEKSNSRQISLTFDGLADRTTMQQILDLLKKYNAKGMFFADGIRTIEDPQILTDIQNSGQRIGNYTLLGMPKMEALPVGRLIEDFCRAQKIIKVNTSQNPNLLKCNDTKYTEALLQAAKACGFNSVVQSDVFLKVKEINTLGGDAFVKGLWSGSIVSVKLSTNVDPITNEPGQTDAKPAIDKQPGLKEMSQQMGLEDKELVEAVEKLLIALQKAKYTTVFVEEIASNHAKTAISPNSSDVTAWRKITSFIKEQSIALVSCRTAFAAENPRPSATEIKMVFTAEPALSYTFGGLSQETVVEDVLNRLQKLGIKATFFVTEVEMKQYPTTMRKIIADGHEIGIAIRPKAGETYEQTRTSIIRSSRILKEQFGVSTNLVKQLSGAVTDTTKEAVAAVDYQLIGQSLNIVQIKHKDYTSADQIMSELFKKTMFSLARGQILYFRMDFYTQSQLTGDLMEAIKREKVDNIAYATFYDNPSNNRFNNSQYTIKPVGDILNNKTFVYQYPVDMEKVPPHLRAEKLEPAIDSHNFLPEMSKRYIGHVNVNLEDRMIGFSKIEDRRLDKSGCIATEDKVIFLTFDDWGSDAAINKLLYVLRKHHAVGGFFVLTNHMLDNPNLLRAIAQEGHDVGSHSDKHKPMAVVDPITKKYVKTQNKEEYVQDLTTSHRKLLEVIGDMTFNGKPILTKFFRPPQLAISKMGVETLFETGYEYIVSGSISTSDYQASSVSEVVESFKKGLYTEDGEVEKGAILVMHMGDDLYTAAALDILLMANEAKSDSDPSKFKVGRLSDYLIDGYSQIDRKKTLRLLQSYDKIKK